MWRQDASPHRQILVSLKDKFSSVVSQRRIRLIENRLSKSRRPRIRLPNRANYWQYVPMDFFFFFFLLSISLAERRSGGKVDAGGQRLMGSCGKEMDEWVKWPGAASTEKGWAARRREDEKRDEFWKNLESVTVIKLQKEATDETWRLSKPLNDELKTADMVIQT